MLKFLKKEAIKHFCVLYKLYNKESKIKSKKEKTHFK